MENETKWVTGKIGLSVGGHPLELEMTVPATPVKARRMLPIFQQMSETFVQIGVEAANRENKKVSCKAGCGACCRHAVPVSEIEAHEIAELVENMPEPQQTEVRKRFRRACEHFFKMNWFEKLDSAAYLTEKNRENVIMEYFYQNIPCPFLEEESCSIHENRPLACREYLVTSSAEHCSKPSKENIRRVLYPVKTSETLREIGRTREMNEVLNFIPLILSLEWAEKCPENTEKKTGQEWMADFFKVLTRKDISKETENIS